MKIWIDGKYFTKEDAKISVFDHGLLYGDGVFEGIRVYNNNVFKLVEHIERLHKSAKAILLEIPITREEMNRTVREVVKENGSADAYLRLVVTRGAGDLGMNPRLCPRPSIIIIAGEIQFYPEKCYSEGIAIMTSSLRRIGQAAKIEANQAGCLEALILNNEGLVAECTGDNVFIMTNGILKTPRCTDQALEGISRATILEIAAAAGIPVMETALTQYDLYIADECFLSGTGAELMPVIKIDGRIIGDGKPGAITRKITALFHEEVRRG